MTRGKLLLVGPIEWGPELAEVSDRTWDRAPFTSDSRSQVAVFGKLP